MKNIIEKVLPDHRWMRMMKMFVLIAGLVWLAAPALFHGYAAASENKAPGPVSGIQAGNAGMQHNAFDTSAVPGAHKKEWAGIQNKLAKEYNACTDDCGDHLECQEKCWKVYEFRLGRELQRIKQKGQ